MDCNMDCSIGIYEVAAIERPTVHAAEAGETARLILAPTSVIANGRSAAISAATRILLTSTTPVEFDEQRVTWMVRRFKGDNA